MPGLLTLDDAAAYLAIAPKTLRNWASQRRLPVVKLSGNKGPIRFRVADLDAFINKSVRPAVKDFLDCPVADRLQRSAWRA
jgi:excisionase family DNA binding protein